MRNFLFIIVTATTLFSFSIHKYYIALTEIEFKEESKSVEMIMNVFIDDIESVIDKEYDINSQLSYKEEIKNVDYYFKTYLKKHFKISINDQSKNYQYIGKEYDGNIVYFYLEIKDISNITKLEIHNSLLVESFEQQQNIIKVKINKQRESLFLTKTKTNGLLIF